MSIMRDSEIEAIVAGLEIGWVQAHRHARQRAAAQAQLAKDRRRGEFRNSAQQ